MHELIPFFAIFSVFGLPTGLVAMFLRQRHREKMKSLESSAGAMQVAALEAARADLEGRMRTLETIATGGRHDLEERLRRLVEAEKAETRRLLRPSEP